MTENQETVKRIAQADPALKNIMDASPVGIVAFDSDARIIYVNPLAAQLFGKSANAASGLRCGDFIECVKLYDKPQECGRTKRCPACPLFRAIGSALEGEADESIQEGEAFLERHEGLENIWVKYKVRSIAMESSDIALMTIEDITGHKQDKEKLCNALAELSVIHEHAPIAMMLLDSNGHICKVNSFAARFVDRSVDEMMGLQWGEALRCLHYLDDPKGCGFGSVCADCHVQHAVFETFDKGSSQADVEARLPFFNGDSSGERCLLISTAYLEIENTQRVLVCLQDITERKQAEKMLEENKERFRLLSDVTMEGIIIHQNGIAKDLNFSLAKLLGYEREELIGKNILDIAVYENDREIVRKNIVKDYAHPYTVRAVKKNGDIFFAELESQKFMVKGESLRVAAVRDITERKNAEAEREKLQGQLLQAQKLESVGRLAGGVAHDINNRLNVILGYAEFVQESLKASDPAHEYTEEIIAAAKKSNAIIRKLLTFARKQTFAPVILDLNEAVTNTMKRLRKLIGENIDLLWQPSADRLLVRMDLSQLEQILFNLVVNARDATTGKGKVIVETFKAVFRQKDCARHVGVIPGEFVMLTISDSGSGMTQEIIDQLYEPFFTTKPVGMGEGLGLSMVYGIVKQNNGFIKVYSEPGKGTAINVYLPNYTGQMEEISSDDARH
jgi:PAS domain S-box-containing protein